MNMRIHRWYVDGGSKIPPPPSGYYSLENPPLGKYPGAEYLQGNTPSTRPMGNKAFQIW